MEKFEILWHALLKDEMDKSYVLGQSLLWISLCVGAIMELRKSRRDKDYKKGKRIYASFRIISAVGALLTICAFVLYPEVLYFFLAFPIGFVVGWPAYWLFFKRSSRKLIGESIRKLKALIPKLS